MITWQEICLSQIYFMRDTIPESKWWDYFAWERSRTKLINTIVDEIQITLERLEPDEQPLRFFYSAFALLAMLVSKRFTYCLQALLLNDWRGFEWLHQDYKQWCIDERLDWQEHRKYRLQDDFPSLFHVWEEMNRGLLADPVREITDLDRRMWCEETGRVPRTMTPAEKEEGCPDFRMRHHMAFDRIQLTIDPFTPVEVVLKNVKALVEERQAGYLQRVRGKWAHELKQGVVDAEFVEQFVKHEQLEFDFARSFPGNKRVRSGGTTFSTWLRSLLVLDAAQNNGDTYKEIVQYRWWNLRTSSEATSDIDKDKKRAKKLIAAAWKGIPLAAIKV